MNESTENQSEPVNKPIKPLHKRSGVYLIIFLFFGLILLSRQQPVNTIDCTPEAVADNPDVIMLGAWWCTYCYQAKKYFQQNNIHYCEYDMENTITGKQLYSKHGGGAIPILIIGEYQLNGFSKTQIENALALYYETKNAE